MNDDDLQERLREELRRRIVPGDAPDRLIDHVARLRFDSSGVEVRAVGRPVGLRNLRRRAEILGGLATAAVIGAILVAGLYFRADHAPAAATPSTSPSAGPSASSSTPTSPQPQVTWTGASVAVTSYGRLDENFGWAVGAASGQPVELYVTTDDGSTWDQRPVPYTSSDNASPIQFIDPLHAFLYVSSTAEVRGYTDKVLRSSDGGRTWTQAIVIDQSGFYPYQLDMVDSQHGWFLLVNNSGVFWLYRTTDGGVSWSALLDTAHLSTAPRDIRFVSADEGWGYSKAGALVHSLDGGETWTAVSLPALPAGYTVGPSDASPRGSSANLQLHAFADQTGQTGGAWVTWTSADAGATWKLAGFEKLSDAISFQGQIGGGGGSSLSGYGKIAGANKGVQSQYESLVLETPEGQVSTFAAAGLRALVPTGRTGMVMSASALSATAALVTIDVCAPADYFASGFGFRPCASLVGTSDGGKTWQPMLWAPAGPGPTPTPIAQQVSPCCTMNPVGERQRTPEPLTGWLDATHGWAVVGTSLYWTVDGGKTWDAGTPMPASGTIQFIDADHGWLVASNSSDPGTAVSARAPVYRTSDGGRTWTSIDLPAPAQPSWTWAHLTDLAHGVVAQCPQLIAGQDIVECEAFTTDDGGMTFQGPVKETYATPITWLSPAVGYGIHTASKALVLELSSDGGRTWASHDLETLPGAPWCYPLAMDLAAGGRGQFLVQCWMADSSLELARYETADGGRTWHLAWHGAGPQVRLDVARVAGGEVVAVSSGVIWVSIDFGQTWQQLGAAPVEIHDFVFLDATTGWLVRAAGFGQSPDALMKTTDGGRTWNVVLQAPSIITNP